jgi:hypothetical protein
LRTSAWSASRSDARLILNRRDKSASPGRRSPGAGRPDTICMLSWFRTPFDLTPRLPCAAGCIDCRARFVAMSRRCLICLTNTLTLGARQVRDTGRREISWVDAHRSLPEYDWLNDLLQSGKSGTMFFSRAYDSGRQFRNDGSRILTRSSRSLAPVINQ